MRFVLDTNIIISAYLGGVLEVILRAFKDEKFILILTDSIVDEYLVVLQRPKFHIEQDEFNDFAALLLNKGEFVIPVETIHALVGSQALI
ncbi:MAG: PIN domain-containing protein [Chloroflexota bacterium]